jgi:hypothetical protein
MWHEQAHPTSISSDARGDHGAEYEASGTLVSRRYGTFDLRRSRPARGASVKAAGQRHRFSRTGNRRINRVLYIMAIVALRNDTEGWRTTDAKPRRSMSASVYNGSVASRGSVVVASRRRPSPGTARAGPWSGSTATTSDQVMNRPRAQRIFLAADAISQRGGVERASDAFGAV